MYYWIARGRPADNLLIDGMMDCYRHLHPIRMKRLCLLDEGFCRYIEGLPGKQRGGR